MKSIHRWLFISLFSGALVALWSGPAAAYRVIEAQAVDGTYCSGTPVSCDANVTITRWFTQTVDFWVNDNAAGDAADPNLTQADVIDAAEISYQAWEDVPFSYIKFDYQGTTPARIAADRINTTVVYNSVLDTSPCAAGFGVPGGLLGMTILTEDLPLGEIIDADVVLDSADTWEWSAACDDFDIQTVLTHEYGHTVGIHHTEVNTGDDETQPTMYGAYFCDADTASGRSLESDDENALQCLYPEQPMVLLMDQTGSMGADNKMMDAQSAANSFIDELADNLMTVTAFADYEYCTPPRDGYELLEDWTDWIVDLQAAVNSTSPCGNTPLWESTCCAIGKAVEMAPANVLVFTDTMENVSDTNCSADCPAGYCDCTDEGDVLEVAYNSDAIVYVIDITYYTGVSASQTVMDLGDKNQEPRCIQEPVNNDGEILWELSRTTGGLYCSAFSKEDLDLARIAILYHMNRFSRENQNPPTCDPRLPIDDVQVYDPNQGDPTSPYIGKRVELVGTITVPDRTFDLYTQYIEDCTGGIQVRGRTGVTVKPGDVVSVVGVVQNYLGELRLGMLESFEVVGSEEPLQAPIVVPYTALDYEMVGRLTRVKGYALTEVSNYRFLLSASPEDERGAISVFLDPDTNIDPGMIEKGSEYIITGVVSKRNADNELKPRNRDDIATYP